MPIHGRERPISPFSGFIDERMDQPQFRSGRVKRLVPSLIASFLFALSFLVLPFGGKAQAQDSACKGVDLVAQLAEKDPALLRRIRQEAAAIPNGDGLLWRVEKDGSAPSYLFGTMHVTDPRVTELPASARNAFAEAETVVIETTDILNQKAMMTAMAEQPELMMFSGNESLADYLTAEERTIMEKTLGERGMSLQSVIKMKPWILISLVSLPECELDRQQQGEPVLDAKLAQEAKTEGKKIAGLETVAEQLSAMASVPMELHIRGLVGTLALGDRMDDLIETMISLYLAGEPGMFRPALGELLQLEGEEEADYAVFEKQMVEMRNHVMAERAQPLLDQGGAFIAIGAMHLPGETGLVALLRQAGYRVSRAD